MKGALLKEFYVWKKIGLAFLLAYIALGAAWSVLGSVSGVLLGMIVVSSGRSFTEDEKNSWPDYSRALPYSTVHLVSARYIFVLAETLVALAIVTVTIIASVRDNDVVSKLAEYFPYLDLTHVSTVTSVLSVALLLTGLAFSLPLYYLIRGQKKTLLGGIPSLIAIAFVLYLNFTSAISYVFPGQNRTLMKIMYYEKWVMPVIAAVTVLLLVLSWIVSIIINTNSGAEKLKGFKTAAVVIAAVTVAASCVSVGVLYKNGRFEKDNTDYSDSYFGGDLSPEKPKTEVSKEPTKSQLKCREDMTDIIEKYFVKGHIDVPLEKSKNELEELGYTETEHGSDKFYLGDEAGDRVSVELSRMTKSDGVSQVYILASIGTYYIEKASTKDLEKIGNNFIEGMTEREMLDKFKELEIVPQYVREYPHPDFGLTRYYYLEYKVIEYNGGESTNYSIHLDVIDGVIQDIRTYDY